MPCGNIYHRQRRAEMPCAKLMVCSLWLCEYYWLWFLFLVVVQCTLSEGSWRPPPTQDSANHLCFLFTRWQNYPVWWLLLVYNLTNNNSGNNSIVGTYLVSMPMFWRWALLNLMVSGAVFHAVSTKYWVSSNRRSGLLLDILTVWLHCSVLSTLKML